jgi:hypothetical protein
MMNVTRMVVRAVLAVMVVLVICPVLAALSLAAMYWDWHVASSQAWLPGSQEFHTGPYSDIL